MLIIQSALIAFGHPLSTFMGLASSQADPSSFAWRWPIAFQGFFLVVILAMLPLLPESPRWLVQHDRVEEATESSRGSTARRLPSTMNGSSASETLLLRQFGKSEN